MTVLIIACMLTALVTLAIVLTITCITLRHRTKRREYIHSRTHLEIEAPTPVVNTPHVIDLHKSFNTPHATPRIDFGGSKGGADETVKILHSSGGHSRNGSLFSDMGTGGFGLGVHMREDSFAGSREALLLSPIPAKMAK